MLRERKMLGSVPGLLDSISCGSTADIVARTQEEGPAIPNILSECLSHLEAHGMHTLGIFRVSSSKKRVRQVIMLWYIKILFFLLFLEIQCTFYPDWISIPSIWFGKCQSMGKLVVNCIEFIGSGSIFLSWLAVSITRKLTLSSSLRNAGIILVR